MAFATKSELRRSLRKARRDHVAAQPASIRALLFKRPPGPLLELIAEDAVIGLYHAAPDEAPAASYARFFFERGHRIALPRFSDAGSAMTFAVHEDPIGESDLVEGAFGLKQPREDAPLIEPDCLVMPLIGFTARGERLGQGGGHYDTWLAAHPGKVRIGLAWDVQLVDSLPVEPHDQPLNAVVTPTRMFGPFA